MGGILDRRVKIYEAAPGHEGPVWRKALDAVSRFEADLERPDPCYTSLVVKCLECPSDRLVPFDCLERGRLARFLWLNGQWHLSVVTKPGVAPVCMGPLCKACARRVYSPELLKVAREKCAEEFK